MNRKNPLEVGEDDLFQSREAFYWRLVYASLPVVVFAAGVYITGAVVTDPRLMNDLQLTALFVLFAAVGAFVLMAVGLRQFGNNKWGLLVLFCAYCAMLVSGLHLWHQTIGHDPFAIPLLNGPYISLDSWSLIHMFLFGGIGFLFPDRSFMMLIYGIVWEVVEHLLTQGQTFWQERITNSVCDIYCNQLGYMLGQMALAAMIKAERRRRLENSKKNADAAAAKDDGEKKKSK